MVEPVVTAVDTNILSDIGGWSPIQGAISENAVKRATLEGVLIISVITYAELAAGFAELSRLRNFLDRLGVSISVLDEDTAYLAGSFHKEYRLRGGTRQRILPDFLIAAHAQIHADRLLTRDHRFFGDSFPGLRAVAPEDLQ